ncbi:MAG TPA: glycosyltransferase, partial [Lacunisphaera sp.]|nr:glycosyltransferase [Lacunisphaera sp.]
MTASATPRFHIDSPTHWRPEAAGLEITGWLHSGPGAQCVDLRARVDRRATLGLYGLDRPDTQAAFGGGLPALRTGFIQRVQVWRGARELALDWHDGTQWHEFFKVALDTSALPPEARKPARILRAAVVYQSLDYLYQHFGHLGWSPLCREADRILADLLTANSDIAIGEHFLGFIENPGYWINAGYDKFRITGWLFGTGREIRQLSATTGVLTENRLVHPKDRPDVAAHHPAQVHALKSGYYGLVNLRAGTPSPVNLKIFAELPDGRRPLAFARRMYLDQRHGLPGPIPIYRRARFYKVVAAFLRGALFGRFVFGSWPGSRTEITRLHGHLAATLGHGEARPLPAAVIRRRDQDPYTRWCWHNRLTPRLRAVLQADAHALTNAGGPLLSVVVPAYNTPEKYLRELLDCLRQQLYPRWELCIADDASPQPHVRRILDEAA